MALTTLMVGKLDAFSAKFALLLFWKSGLLLLFRKSGLLLLFRKSGLLLLFRKSGLVEDELRLWWINTLRLASFVPESILDHLRSALDLPKDT
ncbi:hypothetical protein ZIOFF_012034 [Zingiber officinale]|uniref:Uncharacterized protein n=1 Tax=Zingiber officinale TaxID=94328 RepID=A0A8J5LQH0_ZINOF|nr:hypothetical protein ZIOFF_012034 [Zingiber officinale]